MFDKLDDILMRLEEVLNQLSEPDVAADAAKFQKLMKEQAELQPIADAYKDYKTQKQTIEESLMLLPWTADGRGTIAYPPAVLPEIPPRWQGFLHSVLLAAGYTVLFQ